LLLLTLTILLLSDTLQNFVPFTSSQQLKVSANILTAVIIDNKIFLRNISENSLSTDK